VRERKPRKTSAKVVAGNTLEGRKPKGATVRRMVAERRLDGNGMLERVKARKSRIA
jgi:hypothetical protein